MKGFLPLVAAAALAACGAEPNQRAAGNSAVHEEIAVQPRAAAPDAGKALPEPQANSAGTAPAEPLIGAEIALAGWRRAANRAGCAPLALVSDGGVPAKVRTADFSQGWGVAFDTPARRSAYGFAGTGPLDQDRLSEAEKRQALEEQWPYFRSPAGLPRGSFAGYGLAGAQSYSRSNPAGQGEHSLAYLRIPGQSCLYNVWSRISREHLEAVLDSLRVLSD